MQDFFALRQNMVDNQIRPSDVTDGALIKAFLTVPREKFVSEADRSFAYSDRDMCISSTAGRERWMMSPVPLAKLINALDLAPDAHVLVVGCGTGFSAALLSLIVGSVTALEEEPILADAAQRNMSEAGLRNVTVVRGGLAQGWADQAPYDAVLIDGAVETIPDRVMEQLKPGGTLASVERQDRVSRAVICERVGSETTKLAVFDAGINGVLPGFEKAAEFVF